MPTSWYQAVPAIIDLVALDQPQSVLDIGVGFGKYGLLLREVYDIPYERYEKKDWQLRIDGVEGFEGYRNPIHDYVYNHMYYGNIFDLIPKLEKYDTVMLIDVLEHFEKEEGLRLLDKLLYLTGKSLIVSTPIYPSAQGEYLGNDLETHRSRWTIVDFAGFDYSFSQVTIGDNGAYLFKLYPREHHKKKITDQLNIGYLLPHHGLTGGMKMLVNQMEAMKKRGHRVTAFFKGEEGCPVMPDWAGTEVDREVLVPLHLPFRQFTSDCDIIVAGWIYQLHEMQGADTKVVYWEQGHESLFGDIPDAASITGIRNSLEPLYKNGIPIVSVSEFVSKVLKVRYGIDSKVIVNGIDTESFKPLESKKENQEFTILLVGNPNHRFKSFKDALKVLELVWNRGHRFKVKWVCQSMPAYQGPFPIEYIVNPPQSGLVSHYQEADLFLYTSWYEGFGLPPLEAMACGLPVVTTDCGGVREYVLDQYNCLLAEPGDLYGLAASVIQLMENPETRSGLSENARRTAEKFSYAKVISQWEDFMKEL